MFFRNLILLPLFLVVLSPSLARSAEGAMAGRVYDADGKHWTIFVQPERQSCSLATSFDGDALAFIGLDEDRADKLSFYFLFMKKGLKFSQTEKHDVKIEFLKDVVWKSEAYGAASGGYGGVHLRKLDRKFGVNYSQGGAMFVTIDGRDYGGYELTGMRAGMLRMLQCEQDLAEGRIPAR